MRTLVWVAFLFAAKWAVVLGERAGIESREAPIVLVVLLILSLILCVAQDLMELVQHGDE